MTCFQNSYNLTQINKMTIDELTSNGQKIYNFNGHKVIYSYLHLSNVPDELLVNNWISYLHNNLSNEILDAELLLFIIFDTKSNVTYEFAITKDYTKKIVFNNLISIEDDIISKMENKYCDAITPEKQIELIIKRLSSANYTVATMESCTGGGLANAITNVSGASDILRESYVTYCNDAKIKFGVPKEVIEKYTVYSFETAKAMANAVKCTSNSNIGIGITGQLGRIDPRNIGVENNKAWYCIKNPNNEVIAEIIFYANDFSRETKKKVIINEIIDDLYNLTL